MRKLMTLLFALFLLVTVSACGGSTDSPGDSGAATPADTGEQAAEAAEAPAAAAEEGSIWVLLPDSATSARWETDDRRFFEEAFGKAGVEFTIVNAEGDARTQQTQAEQAITSR